jgi:hypothetical protein
MTQLAVYTPMVSGAPVHKVGRALYRKQVLPLGSISYKGQSLDFTRKMHEQIAQALNDGAFPAVAFQLATDRNEHNADPERTRGVIKGFELSSDGLDALIEVGPRGAEMLEENPNLGVSARLKLNHTREADGKVFPAAIEHVLATLDPRVPNLKPWEKVADLAADQTPVVDLTAASYAPERTGMAFTPEQEAKLAALLDNVGDDGKLIVAPASNDDTLTDAELQAIIDAASNDDEPAGDLVSASLSSDAQEAIDLANATADQARQQVAAVSVDLAAQRWRADRASFEQAGVPPVLLDLAAPVLELPTDAVIELSNTKTVDVAKVVRDMLDAAKGTVDLSAPAGTTVATTPDSDEDRKAAVDAYRKYYEGAL